MKRNDKNKEKAIAYHEAGHAIAAWQLFGLRRVKSITIIPKKDVLGCVKNTKIMKSVDYDTENSPTFEGKIMREIMEYYAGHIAEKKITKKANNIGSSLDFIRTFDIIQRLDCGWDKKVSKYLQKYLYRRAELLIEGKWDLVIAVAQKLIQKKTLDRDDFCNIIRK